MSLSEAFKKALFEKIEDEYDVAVAREAHEEYVKSGEKAVLYWNSGRNWTYEIRG